jgi:2-polyprenyl-3-methyl-5-hydroxy-6-metoxy-1,4-benzoquinol methylase
MRDLNAEIQSNSERDYAYDFDFTIRKAVLDRVEVWLDLNGRSLEIGAFEGGMTEQIMERFKNLSVLEGSSDLASKLNEKFKGHVTIHNQLVETFIPRETYDTIFLVHTLEHLDHPREAMQRIVDWLNPNGKLVVVVPNGEALSRQIAVRMGLIESNESVTPGEYLQGHRRTYTLSTLLTEIRLAKLPIIDHGGVIVKPFSNAQFDKALELGLIDDRYVAGCVELSKELPFLSASVYAIIKKP